MRFNYKNIIIAFILYLNAPGYFIAQELPFKELSLDHITIAVKDLESFQELFSNLGFTIKPGTQHDNSIQNSHIKFEDSTSIELLTATKKRDEISAWYVDRINNYPEGSGVYAALKVDSAKTLDQIKRVFLKESILFREYDLDYSQIISFHNSLPWHPVFFIHYETDNKEVIKYSNHANGVLGINSVSIYKDSTYKGSNIFGSTSVTRNCIIDFNESDVSDRITRVELKTKDLKLMKEYFRKVNRKKFIERIDYEKGKISLLTKFNLLINFVE